MKKILLFTVLILNATCFFAQRVLEERQNRYKFEIEKTKKFANRNLNARSFTEQYWLNYGYVDLSMSLNASPAADWGQNLLKVNSRYTKLNNFTLGDVFQYFGKNGDLYNILGFTSAGKPVYSTVDVTKTSMKLDSFFIPMQHNRNVTTSSDKLIVGIYDLTAVTIPTATSTGNGAPTSIVYGSPLWADSFTWSSQLAYNDTLGASSTSPWYYTRFKVSPNFTLPAGKAFGLRVYFVGDTANYVTMLFSNHDECNSGCVVSPAYISNTTGRQNYVFSAGTASAYDFSGTLNAQGMYGCPTGSESCDMWYPQNLMSDVFVTSTTNFNVKIDPVTSTFGCEGKTLDLASSYSGLDTQYKVSMKWKATSGKFDNGYDTITSAGPTYTFDTLGGFKNIILTGTATNGETAADTITLVNWSMKPVLTTTGKITCLPTDSLRLSIANSAAVGINSNIVTFYDGQTTKNLASNLNDLNSYFGITYNWSSPGASPRSDTTFIYTKSAGTYTVTVTNFAGCQKSVSYTAVNSASTPPTLDFTYTPSSVCINKEVTFNVTAAATRANWTYTFKEGSTQMGTGTSVPYTFTSSGAKSVTLTADSVGCTATAVTKSVTVKSATDAACKSSIHESVADNINIYPNPVRNGEVYIQNELSTPLSVRVTDILGKVIATDKLNANKTNQLDLSKSPNGVYFIELEGKNDRVVRKIVVDRQ